MTDFIWKEIGESLNKRWFTMAFAPTLGFWIAFLWAFSESYGVITILNSWNQLKVDQQVWLMIIGLVVVLLTTVLLDLVQPMIIRIYEGYWSGFALGWLRRNRSQTYKRKLQTKRTRFSELAQKMISGKISYDELIEYEGLESSLGLWPTKDEDLLPTQIGNLLRAAESYSADRYGLDAVTVWPRLYFQLPTTIKEALSLYFGAFSALLRTATLSLVFCVVWMPFFFWQASWRNLGLSSIGLLLYWVCHKGATQAAKKYAEIVRVSFDLHRFDLYEALHWPLPDSIDIESSRDGQTNMGYGQKLSLFLHRGQRIDDIKYTHKHSDFRQ